MQVPTQPSSRLLGATQKNDNFGFNAFSPEGAQILITHLQFFGAEFDRHIAELRMIINGNAPQVRTESQLHRRAEAVERRRRRRLENL